MRKYNDTKYLSISTDDSQIEVPDIGSVVDDTTAGFSPTNKVFFPRLNLRGGELSPPKV